MLVNPFTLWPVTQGWREGSHALPGGGPAIDYGIPWGTPLLSPDDGWVSLAQGGDAGLRVALIRADGSQIILCHGSRFRVKHGDRVKRLQPLLDSGNSGKVVPAPTRANPHAGAHLHTYGLTRSGMRWDWTRDAEPIGTPAGEEDDMPTADEVAKAILDTKIDGFTVRQMIRDTFWQNTQGVSGKKSDGVNVKRAKRIEATTTATAAAVAKVGGANPKAIEAAMVDALKRITVSVEGDDG